MVLLLLGVVALLWLTGQGEDRSDEAARSRTDEAVVTPPPKPVRTPTPEAPAPSPATTSESPGKALIIATWGSGPNQVGRRKARESNPEAPMGLVVDGRGGLWLLDQVNRRVLRLGPDGKALSPLPLGSSTAQDISVGPNGEIAVLDRLGKEPGVEVLGADGRRLRKLEVVGGRIKEGGAITGLFHGPDGLYAETDNDDLVQVANKDGEPTDLEQTIPGRPSRDGKLFLKAGIVSRPAGRVYVQAHTKDRKLAWETPLNLGRPVLQILLLSSDTAGNVYLGAEVGREDPQTHQVLDQATVVLRLSRAGQLTGTLILPPTTASPAETFRPLAVAPDGKVYQMVPGPGGVTVTVYRFK